MARIPRCCGCGCGVGSQIQLIQPFTWEPPYAVGAALKKKKKRKKEKRNHPNGHPERAGHINYGAGTVPSKICCVSGGRSAPRSDRDGALGHILPRGTGGRPVSPSRRAGLGGPSRSRGPRGHNTHSFVFPCLCSKQTAPNPGRIHSN